MGKASRRFLKRQNQKRQEEAKKGLGEKMQTLQELFEAEKYAETINALAEYVQAGGRDAEALYMGAYSYFMTADYERAAQMVNTVLTLAPAHLAARILLARICILEDRLDDGLAVFDFVIEHYDAALSEQQREDVEDILDYYVRNDSERIAKDFPHVAAFFEDGTEEPAEESTPAPSVEPPLVATPSFSVPIVTTEPQEAAPPETRAGEAPEAAADETAGGAAAADVESAAMQDKINEILANDLSLTEKIRVLNAFGGASFVTGALADAEAYLRAALEIDGTDTGTIRNLAVLLHAQGAQDKALAVAAKLPQTDFTLLDILRRED